MNTTQASASEGLPPDLRLAFAPLHKRAFGMAIGGTAGVSLFLVTVYAVVRQDPPDLLYLVANYFPGYTVSWVGAMIGLAWAAFAFFVAGWFCAFMRNLVIGASIWMARTRAELIATRDFLDHI
jgi:hypothetical protein